MLLRFGYLRPKFHLLTMNMNDASIHQRASSSSQSANVSNTSRLEARRETRATKKKANRVEAEKIKNDASALQIVLMLAYIL